MTSVGVGEAKTHLSELLRRAEQGEEIIIERGGTPVARLVAERPARRVFGQLEGQIRIADDFDAPLDDFAPYA